MRAEVYFNLHKKRLSVRNRQTGRLFDHADKVWLDNVSFVVQPAGREKVLREQRKNVHAFVRGELCGMDSVMPDNIPSAEELAAGWRQATYNPYKFTSFVGKETLEPVHTARESIVAGRTIWYR